MSSRAYRIAAAVAFLIAGSGMASAGVEDIPPAAASPDDVAQGSGLFRQADAFGIEGATPLRRPWGSTFTSLSVGGKTVSSPIDVGPPPDAQDELHANYFSSTLDGLFPTTVMDFGPANSPVLNDPVLFGDSAGGSDFFGGPFGSWSLVPSDFDAPVEDDPTPRSGSGSCSSSDGSTISVIRCETEEALGPFMTTSAGSDGDNQSAQQGSLFPGPSAPFGGAYLPQQILGVEMIAAQNNFTITSAGDATQGTLLPPVDVAPAPYDFVNTNGITPNSDPTAPLLSTTLGDLAMTRPATSVPEIPPTAMMLIGFAGLAFAGRRRLKRAGEAALQACSCAAGGRELEGQGRQAPPTRSRRRHSRQQDIQAVPHDRPPSPRPSATASASASGKLRLIRGRGAGISAGRSPSGSGAARMANSCRMRPSKKRSVALQAEGKALRAIADADAAGNTHGPLATSVPEPAAWAMMLIGFCGLGFAARSSRRRAALA
jgi:hypothetical protein